MTLHDVRFSSEVPLVEADPRKRLRDLPVSPVREWQHLRKNGTVLTVETTAHPLTFRGRAASLVIVQDVTDRLRLQDQQLENAQMRVALDKEREQHEFRVRFTSLMSHEFRNPLAAILTSTSLLENYYDRLTVEGRAEHFQRITDRVRHLVNLLDEILMVMRSDHIEQHFEPRQIDLAAFCAEVVRDTQIDLDGGLHTLHFAADAAPVLVMLDDKLFRHALENLLSNAVKYSPRGGAVTVHLSVNEGAARLSVSDHGIGIPRSEHAQLFDVFYRASNAGAIKGTGLGLPMVKQVVERHGGTVQVESEVDLGATFTVTLPLAVDQRV